MALCDMSVMTLTCFGIISISDAVSGFVSAPTLMVMGFMIIGKGISDTGLVLSISKILYRFCHRSSKLFLMILMLLSGALGVFLSPLLGDKLAHRVFSFEETGMVPCAEEEMAVQARTRRKVFAGAILVGVVAAIVFGYDAGVVSVIGAVLMIVSGSVTYKKALQSVNCPIIVLVSSSAGVSIAIQNSGCHYSHRIFYSAGVGGRCGSFCVFRSCRCDFCHRNSACDTNDCSTWTSGVSI